MRTVISFIKEQVDHKSLSVKLMSVFMVVVLPVYMIGMIMNYWSVGVVKDKVYESMTSQVNFYLEDIEKEVESIKMLQYDCLYDENLNRLAVLWEVMDLYERQQRMLQLQNRLVTIRNSSDFIEDVRVQIIPISKMISASEGIITTTQIIKEYPMSEKSLGTAALLNSEKSIYMTTLMKGSIMGDNGLFFIEVEFDQKRLMEKLSHLNTASESGVVIVYDFKEQRVISRVDSQDEGTPIPVDLLLDSIDQSKDMIATVNYNNEKFYVAYKESDYLGIKFIKYVPSKIIMSPLKIINSWFWIFTIASIIILIVFSISIRKYIHEPLTKLVVAFKKVEQGEMSVTISHNARGEFNYIYKRFNAMVCRINNLIDQVYKQKIMTQHAELKQLQSQINPHFLYNSFFLINMMARINDENLIPFTKNLGEYFRFVTKNERDLIALIEEHRHGKVYTDIQMMRFSKRLTVNIESVPKAYEQLVVPRLILQPIIENAFEHAIEKQKEGILNLSYEILGNNLMIIIEDNGDSVDEEVIRCISQKLESDSNQENSGLINIHKRMKILYGDQSGIRLEQSSLGGMKVILAVRIEK